MLLKPKKVRQVYLDHAAATPLAPEVFLVMKPYLTKHFGNPSSLHAPGETARRAIEEARSKIANFFKTQPRHIYFTSGGTEANNLAILGVAQANEKSGKHIITLATEHESVLAPLKYLQTRGWKITFLKVDATGKISADEVIKAIKKDTVLISIMYAHNEIGIIQPIAEIGRKLLRYRKDHNTNYPYFHSDACQATNYLPLDIEKLHTDLVTINSSKIYGPRGAGALYIRNGVKIQPIIWGGGQEKNLRSGTENTAGIVGFGKAIELIEKNKTKSAQKILVLSKYFWSEIKKNIPEATLNGPIFGEERLVNNLNITFPGVEAETLLLYLSEYGIFCSTGSACSLQGESTNHVLVEIGLPNNLVTSTLRFTLGRSTTKSDLAYTVKWLSYLVKILSSLPR